MGMLLLMALMWLILVAEKGAPIALSYLGLAICLSVAALCLKEAFKIWRGHGGACG
jgi:hypothetical protein